jgi:hypothetical protein
MCYIVTPWRGFGSGLGSALLFVRQRRLVLPITRLYQTGSAVGTTTPVAKCRPAPHSLTLTRAQQYRPEGAAPAHRDAPERDRAPFRNGGPAICGRQMEITMIQDQAERAGRADQAPLRSTDDCSDLRRRNRTPSSTQRRAIERRSVAAPPRSTCGTLHRDDRSSIVRRSPCIGTAVPAAFAVPSCFASRNAWLVIPISMSRRINYSVTFGRAA